MAFITRLFRKDKQEEEYVAPKSGDPADALQLVSFSKPGGSVFSGTPFCAKIELALRLADIPFTGKAGDILNAKHAPKHKFPVLRHGDNVVCDSSCIFDYLVATYPDKMKMFVPSDAVTKAHALALQRMLEEDLYFAFLYVNWQVDAAWNVLGPLMFDDAPPMIRGFVMASARTGTIKQLHGQGTGRHSLDFVLERIDGCLAACEALVQASGAHLAGAQPTQADLFLTGVYEFPLHVWPADAPPHPARAVIDKYPAVLAMCKGLRDKAYPDGTSPHFVDKLPK